MDPNAISRQVSGRFAALVALVVPALFAQPTAPVQAQTFAAHVITSAADGAASVFTIDVDGDGDVDVLSAGFEGNTISWYENDGDENFTPRAISTQAEGASSVYARDMDGDGDVDVLSASWWDDKVAWYENDGSENFTEHVITNLADGARSVFAADLDGDGDVDVLSASDHDDTIAWYENDGDENFTPHAISTQAEGARSVYADDVDGDGDVDVLSASYLDSKIAWFENDGSGSFTGHVITTQAASARSVYAEDVDGDGDVDVLSASSNDDKIAWYENDGSENFAGHVITTQAQDAFFVRAADLDGDGDMDVLSASITDHKIAWFENDGSQNFSGHVITTSADSAVSVHAADLDGDGDMDVLSASDNDDTIAWYENLGPNSSPAADAGTDQVVFAGETVTLDGSAATDPDNDPIAFTWTLDGPGSPVLSDGAAEMPTFCAADAGMYTAALTVNDGYIDSDPDTSYVTALSAEEALDGFIEAVEAYGPDGDGTLNKGQTRALARKLDQVQRLLDGGKTDEALEVLAGYLTQLDDLEADGVLTSGQNEALADGVEALGSVIESPCGAVSKGAMAMSAGDGELPENHVLEAAYPNPFNPSTTIPFSLREASEIHLAVYDVLGRQVSLLIDGHMEAGRHEVRFEAAGLPSGTYLVRLKAGAVVETTRVMLTK